MARWSRVEVAANGDTVTGCGPGYQIVASAAQHTDVAPSTPSRLNPRCIQACPASRARPGATRASVARCPYQGYVWAGPSTQLVHRVRWYRPITSRAGASGPKLLMTRPHRGEIACMGTTTSGGPPRVSGLLDHETQIRPRAHKSEPQEGKSAGTGNLHDGDGPARTTCQATTIGVSISSLSGNAQLLLSRRLCGALLPLGLDGRALTCHLCGLLACRQCSKDPSYANRSRS
jgi:hypothetical protein